MRNVTIYCSIYLQLVCRHTLNLSYHTNTHTYTQTRRVYTHVYTCTCAELSPSITKLGDICRTIQNCSVRKMSPKERCRGNWLNWRKILLHRTGIFYLQLTLNEIQSCVRKVHLIYLINNLKIFIILNCRHL